SSGVEADPKVLVEEERLQLRPEEERPSRDQGVEERLLSQPVAGQEELPPSLIPHGKGEHAPQVRQEPGTVLLIEVDDHLRVGPCLEAVPPGLEQSSQFDEVVYLAVQDNPHGAVLIGDGLPAGIEIDDGKAPTRQA